MWLRSSTTIFSLIQNVGEEYVSDSNVAADISAHPSIAAIRKECVAAQFEFNHVSMAETELIVQSGLDPNKATGHDQIPARVLCLDFGGSYCTTE